MKLLTYQLIALIVLVQQSYSQQINNITINASPSQGVHQSTTIGASAIVTYNQILDAESIEYKSSLSTQIDYTLGRYYFAHSTFTNSKIKTITLQITFYKGNYNPGPAIANVRMPSSSCNASAPWGFITNSTQVENLYNCLSSSQNIFTQAIGTNNDNSTSTQNYLLHNPEVGIDISQYWNPNDYYTVIALTPVQNLMKIQAIKLVINYLADPAITNNILCCSSSLFAPGNPPVITGNNPSGGNGSFSYQWQSSADGAILGIILQELQVKTMTLQ